MVETEVPSNADNITTTATTGSRRVGLTTTQLGAAKIVAPTAWWYTSTSPAVEVQVYGTGGGAIAKGSASGVGWHSLSFSLSGAQSQVDALYLDFRPTATSGTRTVSAAFVKFSLEPKVLWGAWIDGLVYTTEKEKEEKKEKGDAPWESSTWSTFDTHASKSPSIVHFGQEAPWAQNFQETPLLDAKVGGSLPLMDMDNEEPLIYEEGGKELEKRVTLSMIAEGAVDSSLRKWAAAVAKYGSPLFFRWDWEMNGSWFDYGDEAIANPTSYKDAWKHFHDIAQEEGATNLTWVWCPNVTPNGGSNPITNYYPGSSYVDWTCLDGYNHGTNPLGASGWISFSSLFSPAYAMLANNYPSKPIMIGEFASTEEGGSKAAWIADALETQVPANFPLIKAVVWFNWNHPDGGGYWDWPIESSATAEAAFAKAIGSPVYSTNTFSSPTKLAPIQPLP
ncbi:MAG TPA: glycosyl hydrolase [Solirubrobacterales bacterium]|nr:glycosyl hydrolase [Solirubrobacterales bacterium]